jgi:hypothetical protein
MTGPTVDSLLSSLSDRTLGLIGLFLGLLSLMYAVHTHRQSRNPKRLVYDTGPTFALAKVYDPGLPIAMTYEGIVTNAVYRTLVLVWNRGSSPIEKFDILRPMHITWTPEAPVVSAGIIAKDSGTAVTLLRENEALYLDMTLVRANEACLIYLDSVHKPATLTMQIELIHSRAARRTPRRSLVDFLRQANCAARTSCAAARFATLTWRSS